MNASLVHTLLAYSLMGSCMSHLWSFSAWSFLTGAASCAAIPEAHPLLCSVCARQGTKRQHAINDAVVVNGFVFILLMFSGRKPTASLKICRGCSHVTSKTVVNPQHAHAIWNTCALNHDTRCCQMKRPLLWNSGAVIDIQSSCSAIG